MAGEPGELRGWRVGHVGVDGDLDQVGAHDVAAGFEDDGERPDGGLQFVGAQIGQQTAHQTPVVDLADDVVVLRGFFRGLLLRVLRFPFVCHAHVHFRWLTAGDGFGLRSTLRSYVGRRSAPSTAPWPLCWAKTTTACSPGFASAGR